MSSYNDRQPALYKHSVKGLTSVTTLQRGTRTDSDCQKNELLKQITPQSLIIIITFIIWNKEKEESQIE